LSHNLVLFTCKFPSPWLRNCVFREGLGEGEMVIYAEIRKTTPQ
jgi:hypothetical protein